MIYSRAWASRAEVRAFDSLSPSWTATVPRLQALADLPYPRIPTQGQVLPLDQLCLNRAMELKQDPRRCFVPLSGGGDSSAVAVSLAKVGARPVIGLSATGQQYTAQELLNWLQQQGCDVVECVSHTLGDAVKQGFCVITGTQGDNLFLGDLSFEQGLVESVWDMSPDEMLTIALKRRGVLAQYGHLFAELPAHLEPNAPNLLWWFGFCQRWYTDSLYLAVDIGANMARQEIKHFFDTPEFQVWMMQDASIRCGKQYNEHKAVLGNAIRRICGLDIPIPVKTAGWTEIRPCNTGSLLAITADGSVIKTGSV